MLWIVQAIICAGLILLIVNDDAGTTLGLDNENFARALYLGVLGAVIAAGLLATPYRLGEIARNITIWILLGLMLVAGYQYRYELQDVASRLSAGIVPGSPLSISDENGIAVMLEKGSNGHFQVRGEVDGTEIEFLIDTGATMTVLTAADARKIGIDIGALSFTIPVSTANGVARAALSSAGEIRIGGISRVRLPVMVSEPGQLEQSLLGMNFLGTLSGFDVRGTRLTLRD